MFRRQAGFGSSVLSSAFDVGELLGDQSVMDPVEVDAPDVAVHVGRPGVAPPRDRPVAGNDQLLCLEHGASGGGEEVGSGLPHRFLPRMTLSVRWRGRLEDAVGGHGGHDGVDVAAVEGGAEPGDGCPGRLGNPGAAELGE